MLSSSAPSSLPGSSLASAVQPTSARPWLARPDNQLLLLLLLAVFPLYYELGRTPVQLWDESRLAVNAAEMARDGHWLVPHFDGAPDHWNTKPPLLIWLEALSFKVFGYSTWALRLPTLVATLTTVLLVFRFAVTTLARPLAGFFAGVVLVTSLGYVRLHVARTADYDALLTCWQVLIWTNFFRYLEAGHRRHFLWVAFGLLAATLTKGPAGLLGVPGLVVYTLVRGKLGWLLKQPVVYLGAFSWLAVVASYFFIREGIDPGYWQAVQDNDLGGRFLTVIEGHGPPWTFYLENIYSLYYSLWLWAIAPSLFLCWLQPAGQVRRVMWLLLLFIAGWLAVISISKSKLYWYDAPIYPALALLLGLGLSNLYQDVLGLYLPRFGRWGAWGLKVGAFTLLFYTGYTTVTQQLVDERHSDFGLGSDGNLGRYLTQLMHDEPRIDNITLLTRGNSYAVLQYYKIAFEAMPEHHMTMKQHDDVPGLAANQVVVVCDQEYRTMLETKYKLLELHQNPSSSCQTLLLLPRTQ